MTRREREFTVLFNALWYKDFPIIKDFLGFGTRAGWTLHVASAVKEAANLMGLFMTFETGGRTDGEIHMFDETSESERQTWAKIEWEWSQATRPEVNEFVKLQKAANDEKCKVAIFFGRYRTEKKDELLSLIQNYWSNTSIPLLCFLLEINGRVSVSSSGGKKRIQKFGTLSTYRLVRNRNNKTLAKLVRKQPAYPWDVKGTKWAAHRSKELPGSPSHVEG